MSDGEGAVGEGSEREISGPIPAPVGVGGLAVVEEEEEDDDEEESANTQPLTWIAKITDTLGIAVDVNAHVVCPAVPRRGVQYVRVCPAARGDMHWLTSWGWTVVEKVKPLFYCLHKRQ